MKILKYFLLTLVLVLLGLLVWGVAVEPYRIDQRDETATIPGLPSAWEGQRVALVADFQVGMWLSNTDTVTRIVEHLVEQQPALVLIAGDFIYHPAGEETIEEAREELEPEELREAFGELNRALDLLKTLLAADIPVYAVLGNHDYGMNTPQDVKLGWLADRVYQALEAAGIRVLENQAVPLPSPNGESEGEALYLVGVGSKYANNADPQKALSQVPADTPRLVLMHNPDPFDRFPAGSAPLAMAGHTHGGQIRLPFTPDWSWMALLADDEVHADGWIDNYGRPGNRLYVNRGVGFSVIPVRLNAVPEVTFFTLTGG